MKKTAFLLAFVILVSCFSCFAEANFGDITQGDNNENAGFDLNESTDQGFVHYDPEMNDLSDYKPDVNIGEDELMPNTSLSSDWMNILLVGVDSRKVDAFVGYNDVLVILSVNTVTGKAKITSVMRDTWVSMFGITGKDKLASAVIHGGPNLLMRTINETFGMNITRYIMVNMSSIACIVESLGGVDIDITEKDMHSLNTALSAFYHPQIDHSPLMTYGPNTHLNGNQAVAYARVRNQDDDYHRTARQRKILLKIAEKAISADSVDTMGLISEFLNYVQTNLTITELIELSAIALQADINNIESFRVPVDGLFDSGYLSSTVWAIIPYSSNKDRLISFIYD